MSIGKDKTCLDYLRNPRIPSNKIGKRRDGIGAEATIIRIFAPQIAAFGRAATLAAPKARL